MDECLGGQGIGFALGLVVGVVITPFLTYLLCRCRLLNLKFLIDPHYETDTPRQAVNKLGSTEAGQNVSTIRTKQIEEISLGPPELGTPQMSEEHPGSVYFFVQNFMSQGELDSLEHGMITDYAEGDGTSSVGDMDMIKVCSVKILLEAVPEGIWQTLDHITWDFDTLSFASLPEVAGKPVMVMGHHLLERCDVLDHIPVWMLRDNLGLDPRCELQKRVFNYLKNLDSRYLANNAYHNATHACDVMKSVNALFESKFFQSLLKVRNWTRMISLLAAAVHDIGHTGQTNNYHIGRMSELAITYNDKSPLEQMHVAIAFQLMIDKPETNWFGAFRDHHYIEAKGKTMPIKSRFRRVIISMILSTDMSKHHEHITKLKEWIRSGTCDEDVKTSSDWQMFSLEILLHTADLSNPTYPLKLSWKWASLVLEEFWQQGDLEKKQLGAASMPMFDRGNVDIADGQCGFIKFVVAGFWNALVLLVPEITDQVRQVRANLEFWEERKAKGMKSAPTPQELCLRRSISDTE